MPFIRLSNIDTQDEVLVNLDHIVQVTARQRERGRAECAAALLVTMSFGGGPRSYYPVRADGGLDSTTSAESEVLWNFQQATQRLRDRPNLPQGSDSE